MFFSGHEVTAGSENKGDIFVILELTSQGKREIELVSKVIGKYGDSIKYSVEDTLNKYDIKTAKILINDYGALDFVIRARIETAIKRALSERSCQN